MKTMLALPMQLGLRVCGCLAAGAMAVSALAAQSPAPRIQSDISSTEMTPLKDSQLPVTKTVADAGRMPANTPFTGITLVFNRSAAQQADLIALLAAQQNPASPLFHQWLTPEQFAARFGMAPSDIDKVESWLQQQGFSIDSVARSGTFIRFSGTSGQVEQAFQTQIHYYTVAGVKHFAPSTQLSVPSALAAVVEAVRDLNDFKPHNMHIPASRSPKSNYSFWGTTQNGQTEQVNLFAPGDIRVAYDMTSLVSAGDTGTGQTIAIMGQSEIDTTDITTFQSVASLPTVTPNTILVPSTGAAAFVSGDEGESDLDLEWSSAMAPGATLDFVYTGNSANNNGVFDSLTYAVDSKIGTVISISYGSCEPLLDGFSAESTLQQAESQGQTVIASSGDSGSTSCFGYPTTGANAVPLTTQEELAVNYPASSEYVTGVGGTEITAANASSSTYWQADGSSASSNILLTSAKAYIPEVAWNDSLIGVQNGATTLGASGGGVSTLYTTKPSWQTGVPGIPSDSKRDVQDVALYASPEYPGYLYCTSDQTDWSQGQTGSCVSGQFYDANGYFTIAGGTSFAAPIFAGMVADINQKAGYTGGQGLINPTLYTLASNSSTYSSAFHDVTTGNNECPSALGSTYCSSAGEGSYTAGVGYDLVTGLGSVDLGNLANAWPTNSSTTVLAATSTTVSASNSSPSSGANVTFTITVAPVTGSVTPTGTVNVSINGGGTSYSNGGSTQTVTLASGVATFTTSFSTAGVNTVVAEYGGDSAHAGSTGFVSVNVGGVSSSKGSFTLAASNVTVSQGSTGTSTVTVTPSGGYTGTVDIQVSTTNANLENYGCYQATNATVSGTTAATSTISIDTSSADCSSAVVKGSMHRFAGATHVASSHGAPDLRKVLPASLAALLGFALVGSFRKRAKWLGLLGCLLLMGSLGLAVGCGGGGGTATSPDVPTGTYTLTVAGSDSVTSTITNTTTFTLTVN